MGQPSSLWSSPRRSHSNSITFRTPGLYTQKRSSKLLCPPWNDLFPLTKSWNHSCSGSRILPLLNWLMVSMLHIWKCLSQRNHLHFRLLFWRKCLSEMGTWVLQNQVVKAHFHNSQELESHVLTQMLTCVLGLFLEKSYDLYKCESVFVSVTQFWLYVCLQHYLTKRLPQNQVLLHDRLLAQQIGIKVCFSWGAMCCSL